MNHKQLDITISEDHLKQAKEFMQLCHIKGDPDYDATEVCLIATAIKHTLNQNNTDFSKLSFYYSWGYIDLDEVTYQILPEEKVIKLTHLMDAAMYEDEHGLHCYQEIKDKLPLNTTLELQGE